MEKKLPKLRIIKTKDGTIFTVRYTYKGDVKLSDKMLDFLKRKLKSPDS